MTNPTAKIIAAIALAMFPLTGCATAPGETESTQVNTLTPAPSTVATTPQIGAVAPGAQPEPAMFEPTPETTPETPTGNYAPGDPSLILLDGIGKTGLFMHQTDPGYWVCNGGQVTAAQGAAVESGTCIQFSDFYAAGELTQRLGESLIKPFAAEADAAAAEIAAHASEIKGGF